MSGQPEVEPPPYTYPYLRVQVYTHTDDGGFVGRIGFDLDPEQTDVQALAWTGKELNRGEEGPGVHYRNAGFPPLGVGDLILLDWERYYLCDAKGWQSVAKPEGAPDEFAPSHSERKAKRQ